VRRRYREAAPSTPDRSITIGLGAALNRPRITLLPRATVDVDLNVFIPPAQGLSKVRDVLASIGFVPDEPPDALQRRAEMDGQFRGRAQGLRIDVFVPALPFYAEPESRRRLVELGQSPIWVLGAEDLVVLKMMFYRRKLKVRGSTARRFAQGCRRWSRRTIDACESSTRSSATSSSDSTGAHCARTATTATVRVVRQWSGRRDSPPLASQSAVFTRDPKDDARFGESPPRPGRDWM